MFGILFKRFRFAKVLRIILDLIYTLFIFVSLIGFIMFIIWHKVVEDEIILEWIGYSMKAFFCFFEGYLLFINYSALFYVGMSKVVNCDSEMSLR